MQEPMSAKDKEIKALREELEIYKDSLADAVGAYCFFCQGIQRLLEADMVVMDGGTDEQRRKVFAVAFDRMRKASLLFSSAWEKHSNNGDLFCAACKQETCSDLARNCCENPIDVLAHDA